MEAKGADQDEKDEREEVVNNHLRYLIFFHLNPL